MNGLLGEFSGDQEVRMLWGSFGDTNLRNESARKCYYDGRLHLRMGSTGPFPGVFKKMIIFQRFN
jgi:hypothetical protein